jgi:hypothetical protein
MIKFFLSVGLFLLSLQSFTQEVWTLDTSFRNGKLWLQQPTFTAYTIRISNEYKHVEIYNSTGERHEIDPHFSGNGVQFNLAFGVGADSILELTSSLDCPIRLVFQNVPEMAKMNKKLDRRNACDPPAMIAPTTWRTGLQAPNPNPSTTYTQHAIIHHSASGNGNSNYTDLVRNYYVQHTQVNGWDDIGYNYLIAANGDIYIGRDKQGLNVKDYQIQGAHYCGKNSGTAGICMIGNYQNLSPTDTSIHSLKKLLSYIFYNEDIVATDSSKHPANGANELTHIAGHRQGCATACPGDSIFTLLSELGDSVEIFRLKCKEFTQLTQLKEQMGFLFNGTYLSNHSNQTLYVYDVNNRLIAKVAPHNQILFDPKLLEVYYLLTESGSVKKYIFKLSD